jgi:serine acetyltransferase
VIDLLKSAMRFWHVEILGGLNKPFSWRRLYGKCKRSNRDSYLFWFRLAYVLKTSRSKFWRRRAKLLNEKISRQYNVEIMLGAQIDEGLWIAHLSGIVITCHAVIGKDFRIWQGCTIGVKGNAEKVRLIIGDGVRIQAHSCVISDDIELGDNVVVGACSFVNKSIPSNTVFFNKRVGESLPYDPDRLGRLQR